MVCWPSQWRHAQTRYFAVSWCSVVGADQIVGFLSSPQWVGGGGWQAKLMKHQTWETKMRNLFLAVALALGLGFAATGAQAAAVSGNVAAVDAVAKSGNSVVENTYYRRRYVYRNRYYRRHWRPHYGYRPYYGYGYGRPYYRHYGYRHRYWRHRRHYY
jgi:hypothetical protein